MQCCPVCSGAPQPVFVVYGHQIGECSQCGHRFLSEPLETSHVDDVYGDDYFFGGGAGYPDYISLGAATVVHGQCYAEVMAKYGAPGRVLDVGAAAGFILKGFTDRGWVGSGIEPNAQMARHGREVLGLDIQVGAFEDYRTNELFDLVSMIQVIGHFYDLSRAMDAVGALTRPGGYCLIEYWDRGSLPATIMGKAWHEYSPPSVLHWFRKSDLTRLMEKAGFRLVDHGTPRKYIMGAHMKSLLSYKVKGWPFGAALTRVINRLPDGLRMRYPALDVKWALFQKGS